MAAPFNAAEAILARGRARALRDRAAILHSQGKLSFAELDRLTGCAAAALSAHGLRRGERVCIALEDSPLFCASFLGAMRAGGVAIPLNTRLAAADIAFALSDSQAPIAVVEAELVGRLAAMKPARLRLFSAEEWARQLERFSPATAAPTAADEPAFWLYSSGTTGQPKAIIHSHANAAHGGKLLREVLRADETTRVLATSKLFFAFALDNALLGPLSLAATTVINAGWPEPERIAAQVAQFKPDVLFSVPSFFRRLLALPAEQFAPFGALRHCYTGGEPLPEPLAKRWLAATGKPIRVCYGMSETFCNALANFPERDRSPASAGVPLQGVQCRLLDVSGEPVPDGEPGVLWLKHPSLALGYKDPQATARAFRDGWFCTGDLFTCDQDGYWYYLGRADDLCKIAGQWAKPSAVEEAALASAQVREAACVVARDADGFERLALFVVPATPGEAVKDELRAALAERLPPHNRPRWICTIAELPRTATGKVQRFLLRERLARELGCEDRFDSERGSAARIDKRRLGG